jgi:hypothetical protein
VHFDVTRHVMDRDSPAGALNDNAAAKRYLSLMRLEDLA